MQNRRVLVFGTFDGVHVGHQFFLRQAKTKGTELVVGIARDEHVKMLKSKTPQHREQQRLDAIKQLPFVDEAVLCDQELGTYEILKHIQPNMIILGHDQHALEQSLKEWMSNQGVYIPIQRLIKKGA